jgi:Zn-dependent protease
MDSAKIADGLFWFIAFLFSTTMHEAAHALVALRGGDATAYRGGQVSISPLPHIRREPIGMVLVPLVTALTQGWAMGWASAPFDPVWAERHPRRAAWMAAAGPAANFLLAALAWGALRIGLASGYFTAPQTFAWGHLVAYAGAGSGALAKLGLFMAQGLSVMFMLNVLLGTFNLLPLPPLDGLSAAGLLFPERTAARLRSVMTAPQFSLIGLLVAWQLFPHVTRPLFLLMARSLHPGLSLR